MRKKKIEQIMPLMTAHAASADSTPIQARRNLAGTIERTDRFHNIDYGLVPFKYSQNIQNKSSLNVRDAVVLCQKAYYNFSVFRNVIDLMTEFSVSNIFYRGGNKKSRDFFEALFNKINLWDLQDKFYREYYRSGNVFIYKFEANLSDQEISKITQIFGEKNQSIAAKKSKIPARYSILNPADIQLVGRLSFSTGQYYKVLSDYELDTLKKPRNEEDEEVFNSFPEEVKNQIKQKGSSVVRLPLEKNKMVAVFYKKQDYEPFAIPMGFPVLEDINYKQELKKMDMAISRTMQQAILLITMGAKEEEGGVNQKAMAAMQELFKNESIGRVLIADYTTKAEFVVPRISELLDPKKYEIVNEDIRMGLNNILVGDEKFSSTSIKVKIFFERLKQGRAAFLTDFLMPEIKRLCKSLGFKNFPTPHFEDIDIEDASVWNRVAAQLVQLGVLTPEEGIQAITTGRLPEFDESVESQRKFKDLKDEGLYAPVAPNAGAAGINTGRPPGSTSPQTTKKNSPAGSNKKAPALANYSVSGISNAFKTFESLNSSVEEFLKKKHKKKNLNEDQKSIAEAIAKVIFTNEEKDNWEKSIKNYCSGSDRPSNSQRIEELQKIADEHSIDLFSAAILNYSQISQQKV